MVDPEDEARLKRAVDEVTFPATKREVLEEVGEKAVDVGGDRLTFGDMLAHVPHRDFRDADELIARLRANVPQLMR